MLHSIAGTVLWITTPNPKQLSALSSSCSSEEQKLTDYKRFEESLQRDITRISQTVIEMAKRDEKAIQDAMTALVEYDRKLAYSVIFRDRLIDELETELDRLCQEFIVRHLPVAGHLRFVFSTIKIVNDLERIGDYAESIARQAVFLSSIEPLPTNKSYIDSFLELANLCIPMLRKSIQAYEQRDANLAREMMVLESQADAIRSAINSLLLELEQRGEIPLEALNSLLTIARRLERTTDQAKNICEEIIYMTTGEVVKHLGADRFRILFVDEDNSCYSQMAEGIARSLKLPNFSFSSVAYKQAKPIDKRLVKFMAEKGIDISDQTSKTIVDIPSIEHYEVMIALTPHIQDILPPTATRTIKLFWPVSTAEKSSWSDKTIFSRFEKSFQYLKDQIQELVHVMVGENDISPKKNSANS